MRPELNLNNEEKDTIREWKQSLGHNPNRKFLYVFLERDERDSEGYKLYDFVIKSDDKSSLLVTENVSLN